jgi:hypothetical protein
MTIHDPVLARFRAALTALYGDRIERFVAAIRHVLSPQPAPKSARFSL